MNNELKITKTIASSTAEVRAAGSVVLGSAEPLERELLNCIDRPIEHLWLDLGEVTRMDAAGLTVLVKTYGAAKAAGIEFVLIDVPPRIKKLLAITRLDTVFPICEWATK